MKDLKEINKNKRRVLFCEIIILHNFIQGETYMHLTRFDGSRNSIETLKGLNFYERSEFRRLLYCIENIGFNEPEALVEIEDGNEVQLISDNRWSVTFKVQDKKFKLIIKNNISNYYVESIEIVN